MRNELNNCTSLAPSGPARWQLLGAFVWPLLLSLAIFSQSSSAELPKFYGKEFARKGWGWSDFRPPSGVMTPPSDDSKADKAYLQQLENFESSGGPYADNLSEPLMGLGRHYAHRGEYKQAVKLYRRALHIVRLNDGLYGEQQAPIVRELLDTIRASGDLTALDDRYDYFFRLYGSGLPPYTDIRVRAAQEYLRWQREALRLDFDNSGQRRLLDLYELNRNLLGGAQANVSYTLQDQWQLALGQIRNLYLLQSRVHPPLEANGMLPLSTMQAISGQNSEIDFTQRELENLRRNAFRAGRAVLEQFIAATEVKAAVGKMSASGLEQKARAVLELADWYQWNAHYSQAAESYARVVQILTDADRRELLEEWLGAPVELPDNGAFWQPSVIAEGDQRTVVVATYDVSARGRLRHLSVALANPEEEYRLYRFKRELVGTRFRPRFENGEAVTTEKLSREYEVYQ